MAKVGRDADEMIASLMNEMGQQQGYVDGVFVKSGENRGDGGDRERPSPQQMGQQDRGVNSSRRQIGELPEYPDNKFRAGSRSIWNPLVMGDGGDSYLLVKDGEQNEHEPLPSSLPILLPTNPKIEVIRRRVFEKFRQEVQKSLQEFQTKHLSFLSSRNSGDSNVSFSKNKNKLPIPSMIEKWHMDAKLEEKNYLIRKKLSQKSTRIQQSPLLSSSIADIIRERARKQQHDGLPFYDPILMGKGAPTIFVENILTPQVRKLWKQHSTSNVAQPMPPKFGKKAKQLHNVLYRLVCEAMDSFESQLLQGARDESLRSTATTTRRKGFHKSSNIKRPKIIFVEGGEDVGSTVSMVKVTFSGVTLKLHRAYLEKLQRLYDRTNERRHRQQPYNILNHYQQLSFEEALFCLLCRYDVIQGAGLQAGVPGAIMDVLLERFDCRMECFASPLNCRYDRFASAFPDVDAPFGSVGSFFELPFLAEHCDGGGGAASRLEDDDSDGGIGTNDRKDDGCGSTRLVAAGRKGICYEANPPFCDGLILQLDEAITKALSSEGSQRNNRVPIMIVVFVPAWRDAECYRALLANRCLSKHLLLKQGEHWYTEGTQHRRKDSFRVASFDTSILFYQNEAAKQLWNLNPKEDNNEPIKQSNQHPVLEELRAAFGQDPGNMQKDEMVTEYPRNNSDTKGLASSKSGRPIPVREPTTDSQPSPSIERSATPTKKEDAVPTKTRKSTKEKKKKRQWNNKEEGKAQLALLESLGLSSPTTKIDKKMPLEVPKSNIGGKVGQRKKKKRRKK